MATTGSGRKAVSRYRKHSQTCFCNSEQYCTELQKQVCECFRYRETAFLPDPVVAIGHYKSLGLDLGVPNEETSVCKRLNRYLRDVGSIRPTRARLARRNGNHAAD